MTEDTCPSLVEALDWVERTGILPPWGLRSVWDAFVVGGIVEPLTYPLDAITEMDDSTLHTRATHPGYRLALAGYRLRHLAATGQTMEEALARPRAIPE